MRKQYALVIFVSIVTGIVAADRADSVTNDDTGSPIEHSSSKVADISLIFSDGFESGDTSAWNPYCSVSSVDLPLPATEE
jgi:uncharacterized protein YabE (DUF348 family)